MATSDFDVPASAIQRDALGRVVLTVNMSQAGPRGATPYEYWRSLGNTGTVQDFWNSIAKNARPVFRRHTLVASNFIRPEGPYKQNVLSVASFVRAQPGDIMVYETPESVAGNTIGKVIYRWNVVEGIDVELQSMPVPVYTRALRSDEVIPGMRYNVDKGDGMRPHEYIVNDAVTPVELYVNPSVDYGVLDTYLKDSDSDLSTEDFTFSL